ncbi:MJ0042-type zinc finger domain-containing protein [Rhodopseudomonas palustris]|uniref:Zinc finger/thioredoxin putative n=1 Tax=Rhodopseudomonas palustris (strain BisB18) TaxID=316056 RepID=Q20WU6_RHOPB
MHIVCPHCTTSYAIGPNTLGAAGRSVRCARCKQVWLARPEDAIAADARLPSMAGAAEPEPDPAPAVSAQPSDADWQDTKAPTVDSPSISTEMPPSDEDAVLRRKLAAQAAWAALAQQDEEADLPPPPPPRPRAKRPSISLPSWVPRPRNPFARLPQPFRSIFSLPTACAAMAALLMGLVIWRADVVRALPQTATFYKLTGLEVNLRGLAIKDVKISSETVEGKPVLVIEGVILDQANKPVDLPRLRFVVRDERGTEIYAWNAVLEQSVLNPGEKAWFRSRLASPPPEARSIDVRFFSRRDLMGGGA